MEPSTISAIISIGMSVYKLLGPSGPSIGDLLAIQTQMLNRISAQISAIQKSIEIMLEELEEIQRLINELPSRLVSEIYRNDLEGLFGTYSELMEGYARERDTNGIRSANQIYRSRIEVELLIPLRLARNKLFTFKDPLYIPYVSIALQVEVHCMILLEYPTSVMISSLNRCTYWLKDLLTEDMEYSIPYKMNACREKYILLVHSLKNISTTHRCQISVEREPNPQNGFYITYEIKDNNFKCVEKISLNENQLADVNPIIEGGILESKDLPRTIEIEDDVTNFVTLTLESNSGHTSSSNPTIIPINSPEFRSALRLVQCSVKDVHWQIKYIKDLSIEFERNGLAILTLGSLKVAALESLSAIERFLEETNVDRNLFVSTLLADEQNDIRLFNSPRISSLGLGIEVDQGSKLLNLAEMPLRFQVLQIVALEFRDQLISENAGIEFNNLQNQILEPLTNPNIGYLLQVPIYTNEFGQLVLPYGQILYPIGVGTEPTDAFAEYLRKPQIRPGSPISVGLNNNTSFIWIKKNGESLQGQTIASEFRDFFIEESRKEALRRNRLAGWQRLLPLDPYVSIVRAKYWTDIERTHNRLIQDESRRQRISELSSNMRLLESEVNNLYHQYQTVQSEISRHQKINNTLNTISTLSNIMRTAMELGTLYCTTDQSPASGSGIQAEDDVQASIEWTQTIIRGSGEQKQELNRAIRMEFQQMQDLDAELDRLYLQGGVPIPSRDIFIPPNLN